MELFRRAVLVTDHFGALYSRAIALKLYPDLAGFMGEYETAAAQAGKDLCASQRSSVETALSELAVEASGTAVAKGTVKSPPEVLFDALLRRRRDLSHDLCSPKPSDQSGATNMSRCRVCD